jgi:hypothetical protein
MDPIHPIIPQSPNIPPVAPSPMAGKIDRERRRDENAGGDGGRKRRPGPGATVSIHSETPAEEASWEDYDAGEFDEDADGGLHVDVSA